MTGVWSLTRFALRQDRVRLTVWLLSLTCLPAGIASSFANLYPDEESRIPFAAAVAANAGLRALTGPAVDLTTLGGLTTWRAMGTTCAFTAIMSFLLVLRHTRAAEESGRLELLRAAPVGRTAPLGAALLTAAIAHLLLAVLIGLTLTATGLPPGGSVLFGLAVASCGLVFATLAAVVAQITEITRPATALCAAALAVAYLLRAVGDASGPQWLSWVSPLGLAQQLRPFGAAQWWTLLVSLSVACLFGVVAIRVANRRDFGSGLLAARPGPARARNLGSAFALAWRLQRGTLLGWAVGFAVMGVAVGALANSVSSLVDDSPQLGDVLTALGGKQSMVDAYLGATFGIFGLMAGAYALSGLLRLNTEETDGRAETLLATPVGRLPWALGHLVIALAGSLVLMLVAGLSTGLAHGDLPDLLLTALSQVFAAWVFAGLGLLLFGTRPSATPFVWAALGAAAGIQLLGAALDLPQAVMDVSPFTHLSDRPTDNLPVTTWLWLTAVTALLITTGLSTLRHRDLR